MAVKYHAKVVNGTYTDKNGQEQTSWLTIGKVIQKQNGKFCLKLDCVPVAFDGWVQFFDPPKEGEQRTESNPQARQQSDDPIPF